MVRNHHSNSNRNSSSNRKVIGKNTESPSNRKARRFSIVIMCIKTIGKFLFYFVLPIEENIQLI